MCVSATNILRSSCSCCCCCYGGEENILYYTMRDDVKRKEAADRHLFIFSSSSSFFTMATREDDRPTDRCVVGGWKNTRASDDKREAISDGLSTVCVCFIERETLCICFASLNPIRHTHRDLVCYYYMFSTVNMII